MSFALTVRSTALSHFLDNDAAAVLIFGPVMTFASGVCSAVLSPLVTTIGFIIWEHTWSREKNRSAFALNLYKCCIASILFLFTLWVLSIVEKQSKSTEALHPNRWVQQHEDLTIWSRAISFRTLWSLWSMDESYDDDVASRKQIIGYLMLSSTLGIIIGDILWLQALEILGTVRVVFMDALKPFCAALFGSILLNEPFRWTVLLGITITMIGIVFVSLEQHETALLGNGERRSDEQREAILDADADPISASNPNCTNVVFVENDGSCDFDSSVEATAAQTTETENDGGIQNVGSPAGEHDLVPTEALPQNQRPLRSSVSLWMGYGMSIINVVLDTYGSVLTKEYGISLSIWEINFIRFGFAGAVLLFVSIAMILYNWLLQLQRKRDQSKAIKALERRNKLSSRTATVNTDEIATSETVSANTIAPQFDDSETKEPVEPIINASSWYMLPIVGDPSMTRWIWFYVSIGVVFVTYIAPTLSNYALFEISLALTLTLTSIGPLYALPLSFLVKRYLHDSFSQTPLPRPPTLRAWIGAALAIAGIILLAYVGD